MPLYNPHDYLPRQRRRDCKNKKKACRQAGGCPVVFAGLPPPARLQGDAAQFHPDFAESGSRGGVLRKGRQNPLEE